MKSKTTNSQKSHEINFIQRYLFLNCPKCHEIPFLSFNNLYPQKINIKCDKCQKDPDQPIIIPLDNYLQTMKNIDLLKDKNKCITHNNFLDIFCYKCHIQFCSKCDENNKHISHKTKTIEKIFTKEKIEKGKKILEHYKDYLKKYIFEFMDKYINKFPKSRQYYIKNDLIKHYINDMIQFFHFYDCILLNYDIDYPNYYQQMNLNYFFKYLDDKAELTNLNEVKLERIFKYSNNNFINKKMHEVDNLIKGDSLDFSDSYIPDAIVINEEFILIEFEDNYKLYNYKNKKYISTLDIKENNLNNYNDFLIYQIYKDIIVIKIYKNGTSKIKILSLFENNFNGLLLLDQEFNFTIKRIKEINNNLLGIIAHQRIEIYKSSENFDDIPNILKNNKLINIKLEKITSIEFSEEVYDFIQTSDKEYIICLYVNNCIIYKSKDFSIFKKIQIDQVEEAEVISINKPKIKTFLDEGKFKNIIQSTNGNYIIGGRNIAIINSKDWSFKVLYDENIKRRTQGYYSGTENTLIYSDFVLTYFNKLICRRFFHEVYMTHFGEDGGSSDYERSLCIFDFNPEKNTLNKISFDKSARIQKIFINSNNEVIIIDVNYIKICYMD